MWIGCAIITVFAAAAPAPGGEASEARARLDHVDRLVAELEYEQAREELLLLLDRDDLDDQTRLEANMKAGIVQRIIGHDVDARLHFINALTIDPDVTLPPGQPPKIRTFFELVRREWEATRPPPEPVVHEPLPRSGSGMRWWLVGGGAVLAGVALVVAVAAVGAAAWGEVTFTDPKERTYTRRTARTVAVAGWLAAALAVPAALGGGSAMAAGVWVE